MGDSVVERFKVSSDEPGKGSKILIRLPLARDGTQTNAEVGVPIQNSSLSDCQGRS
jgi:hypothetical protein